jgi:hypothetical protein
VNHQLLNIASGVGRFFDTAPDPALELCVGPAIPPIHHWTSAAPLLAVVCAELSRDRAHRVVARWLIAGRKKGPFESSAAQTLCLGK